MTGTSWGFVYKFEMMPLSVSLFRLRFANFPVSVLIFRIVLVMSHEDTAGNLLHFLTYKILIELPLDEFRPMGKNISFVSRHPPNTSEHPIIRLSWGGHRILKCITRDPGTFWWSDATFEMV